MKIKAFMLAVAVLLGLSTTGHARLVCSYQTLINDQDKYNSVGKSLIYLANDKISFAAILRQDRANYYTGNADYQIETAGKCDLNTVKKRANFEKKIQKSQISPDVMQTLIHGTGILQVNVYANTVNVEFLEGWENDEVAPEPEDDYSDNNEYNNEYDDSNNEYDDEAVG